MNSRSEVEALIDTQWCQQALRTSENLLRALDYGEHLPSALAEHVFASQSGTVTNLLARHPKAPRTYLDAYVGSGSGQSNSMRRWAALRNPNVSYSLVRSHTSIALNHPDATAEDVRFLTEGRSVEDFGAQDHDLALVANPHLPTELLEGLTYTRPHRLLLSLLMNPNLTQDQAQRVLNHLQVIPNLCERGFYAWASHPNASTEWLTGQLKTTTGDSDGNSEFRRALVANANTDPADVLTAEKEYRGASARSRLCSHVVANAGLDSATLLTLAGDCGYCSAVPALALHPNATRKLLDHAKVSGTYYERLLVLRRWAHDVNQARVSLALLESWDRTWGELLETSRGILS